MANVAPSDARALAVRVAGLLREAGFQSWFVGGCVRDELMGRTPADYDVATDARPEQILTLFPKAERIGAHFGVVLVKEGSNTVEVATFRSDHGYADGRHPDEVTFETDPAKDARRRDFTINGLFADPFTGEVRDYVGGRDDIANGLIRAIGDPEVRFAEDHLRMLRAIRFAARFGFEIEERTFDAIHKLKARIHSISAERIRDEIVRILTEGHARRGLDLMDQCGLLEELLPEVKAFQGVNQPPEFHPEGDVWTHVLIMLELMGPSTETLALGVLLHDVGKPATFRVADRIRFDGHVEAGLEIARPLLERLRVGGEMTDRVSALVEHHMRFSDVHRMKASTLKRFLRLPHFDEHLALHRLDCLSSHGSLDNYEFAKTALENMPAEVLRPKPLLTGHDLIAAGMVPGPEFSRLLKAVEDAQLEGTIETREQALELALSLLRG